MDPVIGFGLGVVLGAALFVLLKKLARREEFDEKNGEPEPIIIIGDGSLYFASPTRIVEDNPDPQKHWHPDPQDEHVLIYPKTNKKLTKIKVNGAEKGQPGDPATNVLESDFQVDGSFGKYLKLETDAQGKNIRLKSYFSRKDDRWLKTPYAWVMPLSVTNVKVSLTVNGNTQRLEEGKPAVTEAE